MGTGALRHLRPAIAGGHHEARGAVPTEGEPAGLRAHLRPLPAPDLMQGAGPTGSSIRFSLHAREQMDARGASESEVVEVIRSGEVAIAKRGRAAFSKNFDYDGLWGGRQYPTKQVVAIVARDPGALIV